jgi:hypothetical protein
MKKNKVYADLAQQNWFWADINAHSKSISTNTQLNMQRPCKNISHIQVLVTHFFSTPLIKLKLGLQVHGERLLVPTHLDQSNNPNNSKKGRIITHFPSVFKLKEHL